MDSDKELTEDEKIYLQSLFWNHNEKIDKKLHEELAILSKYKGELAKNYQQVCVHQSTLMGFMKDIIDKQDETIGLFRDLINVIAGKYPESLWRVDAVEVPQGEITDE